MAGKKIRKSLTFYKLDLGAQHERFIEKYIRKGSMLAGKRGREEPEKTEENKLHEIYWVGRWKSDTC